MHSCEFRVKDEWMRHYRTALKQFLKQFSQVPQMATTGKQIEDVSVLKYSPQRKALHNVNHVMCIHVFVFHADAVS